MNSRKSRILLGCFLLIVGGVYVIYQYAYQSHPKTENQQVSFEESASKFKEEISQNTTKWQNSYVLIKGSITSLEGGNIVLDETIFCQINSDKNYKQLSVGSQVQIKGRFIGYDDLLEEIKLDNCILMN